MAWMLRIIGVNLVSTLAHSAPYSSRFFSKSTPYIAKVGIPEFLNGIGNGVESHVAKLETEIGDFQKLLVTRTLRLKKLGVPCKHAFMLCFCCCCFNPYSNFNVFTVPPNAILATYLIPISLEEVCDTAKLFPPSFIGYWTNKQVESTFTLPKLMRKLILKYAHKYRLGLWRPRAEPIKS